MGGTGGLSRNIGRNKIIQMEKTFVVKIGGNIIDREDELMIFLKIFAAIQQPKILIHGGGKLATELAADLGIKQKLVDGRRITDAATLKVVTMVYGGFINKNIVAKLQSFNCNAIGLCGADANLISADKRTVDNLDYGFVGDIKNGGVNVSVVKLLLQNILTPVIAPLTHNHEGQLLNTNADSVANEMAKALSSDYDVHLIYCFNKKGILSNVEDENSVIKGITKESAEILKLENIINEGMIPKIDNAFQALAGGVKKVSLGHALELDRIIEGVSGTSIG